VWGGREVGGNVNRVPPNSAASSSQRRRAAVGGALFAVIVAAGLTRGSSVTASTSTTTLASTTTTASTSTASTSTASTSTAATTIPAIPELKSTVRVVRTFPHDQTAFTEGLEMKGGLIYESSGLYGSSRLQVTQLGTGKLLRSAILDPKYFAEGLTLLPDNKILQLTWREKVAIVRDLKTLVESKRFSYAEEGWGVCYSAKLKLVVHSDGTNTIRLRSATDFSIKKTVVARFPDGRIPTMLNELECVGNSVYVNVWQTKQILQIDLLTGIVIRSIDASNLGPEKVNSADDVLNGIAYLPSGRLLLTGKRWPLIYEVALVDVAAKK
jgi:glutaminyl-peptide cyclotransferase